MFASAPEANPAPAGPFSGVSVQPELATERLLLRALRPEDASAVRELAGAFEVADKTLLIPHPYPEGIAEKFIDSQATAFLNGEGVAFAITLRASGRLIGAIGLTLSRPDSRAEMGYWIGVPFWGKGYCTEAGRAVLAYGFHQLGLNRIFSQYFSRNPASGKVLAKLGFRHEGHLRQHVKKWDRFEDLEVCSVLRDEYKSG